MVDWKERKKRRFRRLRLDHSVWERRGKRHEIIFGLIRLALFRTVSWYVSKDRNLLLVVKNALTYSWIYTFLIKPKDTTDSISEMINIFLVSRLRVETRVLLLLPCRRNFNLVLRLLHEFYWKWRLQNWTWEHRFNGFVVACVSFKSKTRYNLLSSERWKLRKSFSLFLNKVHLTWLSRFIFSHSFSLKW